MSIHPFPSSPALTSLLKRLGVAASANTERATSLCIVASITNLPQIEQAHGTTFATAVLHIVGERARALCGNCIGTATTSGEHILFVFNIATTPCGVGPFHAPNTAILLDRVLTALGDHGIEAGSRSAFPTLCAKIVQFSDEPFNIVASGSTRMLYGQPGDIWRQQFIEDTEVAASIFCAMDEGRLQFAFETICHATGAETVDYCEALLCERIAGATTRVRLGSLVPALERLGLVRRLDRWVVNSIIKALRADPDARLGCNISAHSARLDAWWAAILNTLSEEPDIARRLIVEITETAPLTEFEEAREFVRVLRSLGCRVALDDVGNGYSSVKNLLCLGVDIAKIDRTFVRDAFGEETARARLRHLVEFAKTCAPSVVVEGVETEVDACVARGCGATFLQGFLFRG